MEGKENDSMAFYGSEELEGIFEDPELFLKSSKGGRLKPPAVVFSHLRQRLILFP